MTILFHNFVIGNKIVLFCLCPYFIYLIQLLDIAVFQLFKHYHKDVIDKAIWLSNEMFDKLEFLAIFQLFCSQSFKLSTIYHAFKSIRLEFFNFNMIFNKIRKKQAQIVQTTFQILSPLPLLLYQYISQKPASIIRYR